MGLSFARMLRDLRAFWPCLLVGVTAGILSSCGGGGGGSGGTPPPSNAAPRISGPASFNLAEGTRLFMHLDISDAEGDPLQLRLAGPDAQFFLFFKPQGSNSFLLQTLKPLDFENPEDANKDNSYEFDIVAQDGHSTTTGHFVMHLENVAGSAFSEEQGMTAILGFKEFQGVGSAVGFAGDLDGDGYSEVLVSDFARFSIFLVSGASIAHSGRGTLELAKQSDGNSVELNYPGIPGVSPTPYFGARAIGISDLDDDHLGEIVTIAAGMHETPFIEIIRGSVAANALQNAATTPQVDVASAPALKIHGTSLNDGVGAMARMPDLDGDGLEEFIFIAGDFTGAPNDYTRRGAAYVVFGSALKAAFAAGGNFFASGALANGGAVRLDATGADLRSLAEVASAGDFDGDGKPDVIVSEVEQQASVGRVNVVYGRAILQARQGSGEILLKDLEQTGAGVTLIGEFNLDHFGIAATGIGDFNKDGLDDVAIGAPYYHYDAPSTEWDKGTVYILFGSRTPFAASVLAADLNTGIAGFIIRGSHAIDQMGVQLAPAGDVNGDGFADFYVASKRASEDAEGVNSTFFDVGRVDLVLGTNAILSGASSIDGFPGRLRIVPFPANQYIEDIRSDGDVDGDGLNDLLVGGTHSFRCTSDGFSGIEPITSIGGAFFVSRASIAKATDGVFDLGDHLFGGSLPSYYYDNSILRCAPH